MADQNTLIELKCHIGGKGRGWSEGYYLPQTSFADAKPIGELIASWRANALCPGLILKWARLAFVDTPRHAVAVIGRPLKPRLFQGYQATPINTIEVGLHYRLETADGLHGNRIIRGIGDDMVRDHESLQDPQYMEPWPVGEPLPDLTNTALHGWVIFRGLLRVILDNTRYAKQGPGPVQVFDVKMWNRAVYRGVSKRDTGPEFGLGRGRRKKVAVVEG